MYRIDDASAATSLPAPEAARAEGYWTEGNPGSGVPATLIRASWLNMIQEEIRNVVTAAGLTPSKTAYNQLLAAINVLVPGAFVYSKGQSGYIKFPGVNAPIIQWTQTLGIAASSHVDTAWPTTFPNAVLFAMANVIGTADNTGPFVVAAAAIGTGNTTTSSVRVYNHSGTGGQTVGNAWAFGIGY